METNPEGLKRLRKKFESMLTDLGMHEGLTERSLYLHEAMDIAATAHQAGTVRFGTDETTSVLDTDCKAHDLDNLYVVDSSFFPSIGAVNPTLTIIANALRVGEHLTERLAMIGTLSVLLHVLAVDPVPWARAQMAFTLAFHIILVPLGVSWAAMALIANYRAIKHDDADALLLAQRWSKYMAVTFAVGAVTGTVLTFEFGLLWPKFMGQWGDAFGMPFALEGLFFFTEAIFVAIYIYGWRRLKPWPHFWTGVPIVIAGIGGSVSVVAANAWMNEPSGFTLNSAGKVVDVDPLGVIFNKAMPLRGRCTWSSPPTSSAASSSRRCTRSGCSGAGATGTTGSASSSRSPSRDRDRRSRWASATRSRAGSTTTSREKFAAIELVPKTKSDVPETLLGHLQLRRDRGRGRDPDPGPGVDPLRPERPARTPWCRGATRSPTTSSRRSAEANTVHLAWDVMVGARHAAVPARRSGTALSWLFRRDIPKTKWFLRIAVGCRRARR